MVIDVPLKLVNNLPVQELAGKIVIDTYMAWRDGLFSAVESGDPTVQEQRYQQLSTYKVAKALTHIQAPRTIPTGQPAVTSGRLALAASSDYPEELELALLYDPFGFDTVDHNSLSASWRSGPGQPAWAAHWRRTRDRSAMSMARGRWVKAASRRPIPPKWGLATSQSSLLTTLKAM